MGVFDWCRILPPSPSTTSIFASTYPHFIKFWSPIYARSDLLHHNLDIYMRIDSEVMKQLPSSSGRHIQTFSLECEYYGNRDITLDSFFAC